MLVNKEIFLGKVMAIIKSFFHQATNTFTHVVHDDKKRDALIIDPVLDFDEHNVSISKHAINEVLNYITASGLKARLIIDTHLHADHLSASFMLKDMLSCKSAIGHAFMASQEQLVKLYELDINNYKPAYDIYLHDDEIIKAGALKIKVINTPGHTKTCISLLIDDALFVGDALLQPDLGCGRCDLIGGNAKELFASITHKIFCLPDNYKIFVGHDYPIMGDDEKAETSVIMSKKYNVMINEHTREDHFINARVIKDKSLGNPKLLPFAMQVNILGGQLPKSLSGNPFMFLPISDCPAASL